MSVEAAVEEVKQKLKNTKALQQDSKIVKSIREKIDAINLQNATSAWGEKLAAEELARLAERVYFGSKEEDREKLASELLPLFLIIGVDINLCR